MKSRHDLEKHPIIRSVDPGRSNAAYSTQSGRRVPMPFTSAKMRLMRPLALFASITLLSGCYEQFGNTADAVKSTSVITPEPLDLEVDLNGEATLAYIYDAPNLYVNLRYSDYPYKSWSNPGELLYNVEWYLDGRPYEQAFITSADLLMDAENASYRYATVSFFVEEDFFTVGWHSRFLRSVDGGRSWTVNSEMLKESAKGSLIAQNPDDPDFLVFAYRTSDKIVIDISDDRGASFVFGDIPPYIDTFVAHEETYQGTYPNLLDLKYCEDGTLYLFYARTSKTARGDDSVSFWVKRSRTQGLSWDLVTRIDDGIPGYNIDDLGGSLEFVGLDVHAAWGDGYFVNHAYSTDDGETWSEDARLASQGYGQNGRPDLGTYRLDALMLTHDTQSPVDPDGHNLQYRIYDIANSSWSGTGRVNNYLGAVNPLLGNALTVDDSGNFIQAFAYDGSLGDENYSIGVAVNTPEPGDVVSPLQVVVDESSRFIQASTGDTIRLEYQVTNNSESQSIKPSISFRYQTRNGTTGSIPDMRGPLWHNFARPLSPGQSSTVRDFKYVIGPGVPSGTYRFGVQAGQSATDFQELEIFTVDVRAPFCPYMLGLWTVTYSYPPHIRKGEFDITFNPSDTPGQGTFVTEGDKIGTWEQTGCSVEWQYEDGIIYSGTMESNGSVMSGVIDDPNQRGGKWDAERGQPR